MEPIANNWSIVIAGYWNPMIFNPQWIAKNLTDGQEIGIAVPVNNPTLPIRLDFESISLFVSSTKIIIMPKFPDDDNLNRAKSLCTKILELLPHTPISAVGINLGYQEDKPASKAITLFSLDDRDNMADHNMTIKETSIRRNIDVDIEKCSLNLTLVKSIDSDNIIFDFNFHSDVESSIEAMSFLNRDITIFKGMAESICKNIYSED